MKRLTASLIVVSVVLTFVASAPAVADNLVLNVPDWNQPNPAEYPGDNLPVQINNVDAYSDWCSPTAGANIMGYWEDVMGCTGLTDGKAYNATTAYPGTANTWQQGLYHDGIVEMGWRMDTGGWRTNAGPFPPYQKGGTQVANIFPGLMSFAQLAWTDDNYPGGGAGTGIVKKAFPLVTGFKQNWADNGMNLGLMWATYTNQIDLAHPVEMSFDRWVDTTKFLGNTTVNGQTVSEYAWEAGTEDEGHSVVGVGYFSQGGVNWLICQDGWGPAFTPQYVAVQMQAGDYAKWTENDYVTSVPEPSTLVLLGIGALGLLAYAWRRRRS